MTRPSSSFREKSGAPQLDTDGDGIDDGQEVILMGTDPLDPTPDPVPEPAIWLMIVAGAAFLGVLYRRRDQENGAMGRAWLLTRNFLDALEGVQNTRGLWGCRIGSE
jgi:hypothetical protein